LLILPSDYGNDLVIFECTILICFQQVKLFEDKKKKKEREMESENKRERKKKKGDVMEKEQR
jgi:hypothetical protein